MSQRLAHAVVFVSSVANVVARRRQGPVRGVLWSGPVKRLVASRKRGGDSNGSRHGPHAIPSVSVRCLARTGVF